MKLTPRHMKVREMRRGLLRVIAYLAVLTAVLMIFTAHRARAEFSNQTLELGRQMAKLAHTPDHTVQPIKFNGQKIIMGSATSDASPDDVLKEYEQYCQSNVAPAIANFHKELGTGPVDPPGAVKDGFVRTGEPGGEGAVMCFVKTADSKESTREALKDLSKTGRLGVVGALRYAYAHKGTQGKTLVLTAWTDDKFNVKEMFPTTPDTDVPGEEFADAPRVANAVRYMSISAADKPYGINVYKTDRAPADVIGYFDREMKDKGWFVIDPEIENIASHGYMKDGVVLSLTATSTKRGNYYALSLGGVSPQDQFPTARRTN